MDAHTLENVLKLGLLLVLLSMIVVAVGPGSKR
jgi:hypothetical protein